MDDALVKAEQQIATLTAERDQLQADLYGKPPYRPGAYAQIELEIKVRDEYLTRAEAAEARATALVDELDTLCQAVEGRRAGALTNDGLWYYVVKARTLLPPSQAKGK